MTFSVPPPVGEAARPFAPSLRFEAKAAKPFRADPVRGGALSFGEDPHTE